MLKASASAEINSAADVLLQVREQSVIVASGLGARKIAALVLIIVSEYQHSSAIGQRPLIAGRFSLGYIYRIGWAEERTAGHQPKAGRNLARGRKRQRIKQRDEIYSRDLTAHVPHQGRNRLLTERLVIVIPIAQPVKAESEALQIMRSAAVIQA